MKLTEHFTLESMLRSQTATRCGYTEQFTPSAEITENLQELCVHILEPLRISLGKPVYVSSGWRCPRLNTRKKGAKNSQHLLGQAADIEVEGMTNAEIITTIKKLELPFDQLIEEFHQWIHVSYGPRNRRELLTATKNANNETIYS
jgi:zinc D-Ala-D-Ala carboxypeptidase